MDTRAFLRNERTQRDRALLEADPVARQKELEARVSQLEQDVQRLMAIIAARGMLDRQGGPPIAYYSKPRTTAQWFSGDDPMMLGRAVNQSAHDFVLVKS